MIIHCTQKLAKRLPGVSPAPLEETSPIGSWHANLLVVQRRRCVLFCHDLTRYALFLPSLRKSDFERLRLLHRELFLSTLHGMGFDEKLIGKVAGIMDKAGFDTVTDRSVLSSMRVVQHDLEPLLIEEGDVMNLYPVAVSCKFSHRPAAVRGRWIWPDQRMADLLAKL